MSGKKKSLKEKVETEIVETCGGPGGLKSQVEKTRSRRRKSYIMDLRIHSPASLGYLGIEGIDTAPAMVRLARVKGLDVIAVTDFYSGKFVDRVQEAAEDTALTVIPGVVVRASIGSCDDVILSCLFPESCGKMEIESFLAELKIPERSIGDRKYLVKMPFEEVLRVIDGLDGVALPSRMDKTPHRLAALPALIEDYGFRAFDLAYADSEQIFKERWPKMKFQLYSFSNANALAQVGSRIAKIKMFEPGFSGLRDVVAREAQL